MSKCKECGGKKWVPFEETTGIDGTKQTIQIIKITCPNCKSTDIEPEKFVIKGDAAYGCILASIEKLMLAQPGEETLERKQLDDMTQAVKEYDA